MSTKFSYRTIVRFAEASEPYGLGVAELSITFNLGSTPIGGRANGPSIESLVEHLARFEWSGAQASYSWKSDSDAGKVFRDEILATEDLTRGYWLLDITDHMTGRIVGWGFCVEIAEG